MTCPTNPAVTLQQATNLVISAANDLYEVINGLATEEVTLCDSQVIPTLRKALLDNFYFLPAIPYVAGVDATEYNQLYTYTDYLIYAPSATVSSPVTSPADPLNSGDWQIFSGTGSSIEQQPRVVADGVTTVYDSPASSLQPARNFIVTLDGVKQDPVTDYDVLSNGDIEFTVAPEEDVAVDIIYFKNTTIVDNQTGLYAQQAQDAADAAEISADEAEASALSAAGSANYQGEWSTLTGAYSKGITVSEGGIRYLLKVDLADITTSQPSLNPSDWDALNVHNVLGGRDAEDAHPASAINLTSGDTVQERVDKKADREALAGRAVFESTADLLTGTSLDGVISDSAFINMRDADTPIKGSTIGFYQGSNVGEASYIFLSEADRDSLGHIDGYSSFQVRGLDVYACLSPDNRKFYATQFGAGKGDGTDDAAIISSAAGFVKDYDGNRSVLYIDRLNNNIEYIWKSNCRLNNISLHFEGQVFIDGSSMPSNTDMFTLLGSSSGSITHRTGMTGTVFIDMAYSGRDGIVIEKGNHINLPEGRIENAGRNAIHFDVNDDYHWIENVHCTNMKIRNPGMHAIAVTIPTATAVFVNLVTFDQLEIRGQSDDYAPVQLYMDSGNVNHKAADWVFENLEISWGGSFPNLFRVDRVNPGTSLGTWDHVTLIGPVLEDTGSHPKSDTANSFDSNVANGIRGLCVVNRGGQTFTYPTSNVVVTSWSQVYPIGGSNYKNRIPEARIQELYSDSGDFAELQGDLSAYSVKSLITSDIYGGDSYRTQGGTLNRTVTYTSNSHHEWYFIGENDHGCDTIEVYVKSSTDIHCFSRHGNWSGAAVYNSGDGTLTITATKDSAGGSNIRHYLLTKRT